MVFCGKKGEGWKWTAEKREEFLTSELNENFESHPWKPGCCRTEWRCSDIPATTAPSAWRAAPFHVCFHYLGGQTGLLFHSRILQSPLFGDRIPKIFGECIWIFRLFRYFQRSPERDFRRTVKKYPSRETTSQIGNSSTRGHRSEMACRRSSCANQEIFPEDAKAGGAKVASTGRSDYPKDIFLYHLNKI